MTVYEKNFLNLPIENLPLDIIPVAGRIGAEIQGINLADELSDEAVAAIRAALNHHKVIFFRGQHNFSDAEHERLAERFGKPVAHPTVPVAEGSRYLLELDSREGYAASTWHTDVTFLDSYPAISILRSINAPAAGGDTLWANTASAYDNLPTPLKSLVDDLWAVHSNDYDYSEIFHKNTELAKERRKEFTSTLYETHHPVVHIHPETQERNLLIGHFVKNFIGLNQRDSHDLIRILQEHITRPENTVRWRWQAGDVAIWDNRATQHRAIADFGTQRRTLRRATIAGTPTVAINGKQGKTISINHRFNG